MLLDKKKFDKAMPRNVRNTKNLYKFYHNSLCDELWVVKKSGEFGKNCVSIFGLAFLGDAVVSFGLRGFSFFGYNRFQTWD